MENLYSEPRWCEPQDTTEQCSSLIATGPSPMILTGVFTRLIQYHFSDPNNIQNRHLKDYIWTSSPNGCISKGETDAGSSSSSSGNQCPTADTVIAGSRLLVSVSYKQDGANVQQRPAVYIKREPYTTDKISFENKALSGLNGKGVFEGTAYQVTVSGKHSIIAMGKTGAEADALGEEIYFRMLQFMPIIKDDIRLGHFLPNMVSEVRDIKDESSQAFYTVVSLAWAYVYRWRVIAESPIVKRLALLYTDY